MAAFFTTDLPSIMAGLGSVIDFAVTTFPVNVIILLGVTAAVWKVATGFLGGRGKTSVRKAR